MDEKIFSSGSCSYCEIGFASIQGTDPQKGTRWGTFCVSTTQHVTWWGPGSVSAHIRWSELDVEYVTLWSRWYTDEASRH